MNESAASLMGRVNLCLCLNICSSSINVGFDAEGSHLINAPWYCSGTDILGDILCQSVFKKDGSCRAQPGMVFTLMLYSDHDIWDIEY